GGASEYEEGLNHRDHRDHREGRSREMMTENYLDEEDEPNPDLNRISNAIIGAAIEVHTHLKPGLLEFLYEQALAIEFKRRQIPFERQVIVPVYYKGEWIGEQRIDFVVDGKV